MNRPHQCPYDMFVARRRWPLLRLSKPVPAQAKPVFVFPVRDDLIGFLSPPPCIPNFGPKRQAKSCKKENCAGHENSETNFIRLLCMTVCGHTVKSREWIWKYTSVLSALGKKSNMNTMIKAKRLWCALKGRRVLRSELNGKTNFETETLKDGREL